jgi:ribose transport system substrate-binding protein
VDTYRRRQTIQALLKERGELSIDQLVLALGVSPNTVRNDLNAMAADGMVRRLRGGAAPAEQQNGAGSLINRAFAARCASHPEAKRVIARWAAELVEDGDSILLDASSSVFYLVELLRERNNLTVVTSGIEAGRLLAHNPSNTVFLLGGQIRPDGQLVTSIVGEEFLRDLHIKTGFVSCSGFTPQAGLTEWSLSEAHLKRQMVAAVGSVVALVDSSKFGRVDLAPFATLGQIAHLYTESSPSAEWISAIQEACADLTVCAPHGVSRYASCVETARHYRIGFANLGEQVPFAVEVRRALERAANESGDIDLLIEDNQLSPEVALLVAERLIEARPDLVIEFQIDERQNAVLMDRFRRAGIPVIAVDIPMPGATFFGADNYRAGWLSGQAIGRWILEYWGGKIDRLIVLEEPRAGATPGARIEGQIDAIEEAIGPVPSDRIIRLEFDNRFDSAQSAASQALAGLPDLHRLAFICFNDDAAIGALSAARSLGREDDVVLAGQGADRKVRDDMRKPGSRIVGSTAYFPERYGDELVALARRVLRGEPVPPAVYIDHVFITIPQEERVP